jgi:hypothetical protein
MLLLSYRITVSTKIKRNKNMQKFFKVLMAITIIASTYLVRSGTAGASPGPFTCSPNFYQVISGTLELLNPTTGAYTNIGPNAGFNYNAIGYDTLDNYIYGLRVGTNEGDLVRVASDGSVTDLGLPTGLPAGDYDDGSTDLSGNLYVQATSHSLYEINLATETTTVIPLTGVPITGYDSVIIGTNLYKISGDQLYTVNLTTDVATSATVTGPANWLNSSTEFGADWSDQAGELYVSNNGTGSIYEINNYNTNAPNATFVVAGTVTSQNDGASCTLATHNPFVAPVANNDSYTTGYNTALNETTVPVLANDSGTSLTVVSNTNPSHGSVTLNGDGTFSYVPSKNFIGTDSFQYTISDSFGRTATATVTITTDPQAVVSPAVTAPSTGFGVYQGTSTNAIVVRYGLVIVSLLGISFGIRRLTAARSRKL